MDYSLRITAFQTGYETYPINLFNSADGTMTLSLGSLPDETQEQMDARVAALASDIFDACVSAYSTWADHTLTGWSLERAETVTVASGQAS